MDSISFYDPQRPSLNSRAHPTALYQNHGLVTVAPQSPRSNRDGFSGGKFRARTFKELNSCWSQRDMENGSTAMVACKASSWRTLYGLLANRALARFHSRSRVANHKDAGNSQVAEISSTIMRPGSSQGL